MNDNLKLVIKLTKEQAEKFKNIFECYYTNTSDIEPYEQESRLLCLIMINNLNQKMKGLK